MRPCRHLRNRDCRGRIYNPPLRVRCTIDTACRGSHCASATPRPSVLVPLPPKEVPMLLSAIIADTAEVEKNLSALQKFVNSISLTKWVTAAVLLVVCLLVTKLILKGQDKILGRSKLDKSLHGLTRSFTKILLLFITVMVVAGSLGVDTS